MVTVLVVDDVEIIRLSIQQILREKHPQFNIIGANNGLQALDIIDTTSVDIVLTDIKMPICDGLELTKKLREEKDFRNPVIIITGFGEFSYAQEALRLQTVDYLLKPISHEKLYAAVEAAMKQLNDMDNVRYAFQAQEGREAFEKRQKWRESIQYSLLISAPLPLFILKESYTFGLAAFAIKQDSIISAGFNKDDYSLVTYGVQNAIEDISRIDNFILMQNPSENGEILMIFYNKDEIALLKTMQTALEQVHKQIETQLRIKLLTGVSSPSKSVNETMYEQAHNALTCHLSGTQETLFWYSITQGAKLPSNIISDLKELIKSRKFDNLEKYLIELFAEIDQNNLFGEIEQVTLVIASSLVRESTDGLARLKNRLPLSPEKLSNFETTNDVVSYIRAIVEDTLLIAQEKHPDNNMTNSVKEYIDKNYTENISIRELASELHISYAYLSAQFSKEVGESITSYLLRRRMEVAKSLLVETTADIHTIAAKVGYSDLQYFYRVFKKYASTTPIQYRNSQK